MPNTKHDRATVSNDWKEVKQFARTMNVAPWLVYKAKHETSSRTRRVLKSWIEQYGPKPEQPQQWDWSAENGSPEVVKTVSDGTS